MRLEVRGIKKSFGDKEVLHGVSFEVMSGRAMGFLGRNGAGKSTTIRCLMDVFHQDEGGFYMDGAPLDIKKHRVGYLPEERGMYQKHTVMEQLCYFARLRGATKQAAEKSASEWVDYFGLSEYKNKKLETLSKGNQQKIQIAQCFLNEPDILILDDSASALDFATDAALRRSIKENTKKATVFLVSQRAATVKNADQILVLDDGKLVGKGTHEELLKNCNVYKEICMSQFSSQEVAQL